jgi:hypothetical protein
MLFDVGGLNNIIRVAIRAIDFIVNKHAVFCGFDETAQLSLRNMKQCEVHGESFICRIMFFFFP